MYQRFTSQVEIYHRRRTSDGPKAEPREHKCGGLSEYSRKQREQHRESDQQHGGRRGEPRFHRLQRPAIRDSRAHRVADAAGSGCGASAASTTAAENRT